MKIKIEKIANPGVQSDSIDRDIHEGLNPNHSLFDPGFTDFFYDSTVRSEIYMGNLFPNVFSVFGQGMQQRFDIGKSYGRDGIDINLLLTMSPDDTYYEIDGLTLMLIPKRKCIHLLKNFNVILHDHMEGLNWGFFKQKHKDPINLIKEYGVVPRNLYVSSCSGDDDVSIPELNIKSWYMPIWWMIMYSKFPHDVEFKYNPTKLALIPARKARAQRVKILAKIHEKDLLDQCDWSLIMDMEEKFGDVGDFLKSPSIHYSRFPLLYTSEELYIKNFYNDVKDQLPKYFEQVPHSTFGDNHLFDLNWMGQYCYYINTETNQGEKGIFTTEKTFKGMMLGIPMLNSASVGYDKFLNKLGFLTIGSDEFDHLCWDERSHAIVDYVEKPIDHEFNKYVAEHNFNMAHDINRIFEIVDKEAPTRQ